jgi:hypothetical protein
MCHRNIHPRNVICAEEDYFLVDYRFSTASNEATTVTQAAKAHYGKKIKLLSCSFHPGVQPNVVVACIVCC